MVKEDARLGLGPIKDGPVNVRLRWVNPRARKHHVRGPKKSPRKIVLWRLILRKVEEEKRTAIFFCEEGEECVDANYHPLKISSDIFSCYLQANFFYLSSALIGAESQDFRHGHRTEYNAHVFNVNTSRAGSCSIFPPLTWAPCPKR